MLRQPHHLISAAALAMTLEGCATHHEIALSQAHLKAGLEHEMVVNTSWVRIHAADALLDQGESQPVETLFKSEADTAQAPYRIGVWRVLARSTTGAERTQYIERIRAVAVDPGASDRISAAETLGKLHVATRADRKFLHGWLATADEATAVFPRWLLVQTSNADERTKDEAALADLLNSKDPVARLRAAFALGRLKELSTKSVNKLKTQLNAEPFNSVARVYLITGVLLHEKDASVAVELKKQLVHYFKGRANEQLEAATVLGLVGGREDLTALKSLLNDPEADARIGAANGMLHLLK